MDLFQLIGDFLHLIAVLMLLLKIMANKNVIGTFPSIQGCPTGHRSFSWQCSWRGTSISSSAGRRCTCSWWRSSSSVSLPTPSTSCALKSHTTLASIRSRTPSRIIIYMERRYWLPSLPINRSIPSTSCGRSVFGLNLWPSCRNSSWSIVWKTWRTSQRITFYFWGCTAGSTFFIGNVGMS